LLIPVEKPLKNQRRAFGTTDALPVCEKTTSRRSWTVRSVMKNPSFLALGHQMSLQRQMEVIANNIANSSTTGFKAERMMFSEHLSTRATNPGVRNGERVAFVEMVGTQRDERDGTMIATGNPFDLAINGPGYFTIETPAGPRYSRDGRFRLDGEGQIVNPEGLPLLDDTGRPIRMRAGETRFEVARNGRISSETGEIARLRIVRFEDERALRQQGGNLFAADTEPMPVDVRTEIVQGGVEGSNVQSVVEITTMIELMRRYQNAAKLVENEHEAQRKAIERLARAS
jgi:flagellar basal-body rod protein FlgF